MGKGFRGLTSYARWGFALAFLLVLCSAVPVIADSESTSPIPAGEESIPAYAPGAELPNGVVSPSEQDMAETIQGIEDAEGAKKAALASPAAMQEREASQNAYAEASPGEAEELLMSKFSEVLAGLNNDPARWLSDAKLDKPLSETAAQVTREGKTSLMEGVVPVQAENEEGDVEKVDLGLEKTNAGWVSANPIVEVAIAPSVEEGVEVGDEGLTITQAGAEDSVARPLGDKNLFFSEIEEGSDTDLLVSPTAGGVELFDMLRSAASPETLRFHIELPEGGELRPTPSGGAEVVDSGGKTLAEVPTPHARDAQGRTVPVTLEVEGDSVVLRINHHEKEVAYPILVDPEVVDNWYYSFYNNQSLWTLGAWGYQEYQSGWLHHGTSESTWPGHGGLFFASEPGGLPAGQWGQYLFNAPNSIPILKKARLFLSGAATGPAPRRIPTRSHMTTTECGTRAIGMRVPSTFRILTRQTNSAGRRSVGVKP